MNVVLIGTGNLSHHLGLLFRKNGINVIQIVGRNSSTSRRLAGLLQCEWTTLPEKTTPYGDLYLISVSDHEISGVIERLPLEKKVVAHVSGTVPLTVFPKKFLHAGVFWPLQTFSKNIPLTIERFPICTEGRSPKSRSVLKKAAKAIACRPFEFSSKDREWIHLSAVLANNFSNHLFALAEKTLSKKGLPSNILHPLIQETAAKTMHGPAFNMQTGPAKRGDAAVINQHLRLLKSDKRLHDIYKLLSSSIEETQGTYL